MKKVEDKLNEILDIAEKDVVPVESKPVIPRPKEQEDITNDYKYSRENLYNLVERGQDAIDGILTLAKETEHPRTYEVAGQLIKTVGDTAEKLLDIQKKIKELEKEEEQKIGTQHNHLYVGSTSDLQKFLKKNGKAEK